MLPLQSQYILSLSFFVIHNKNYFELNSEIHSSSTRTKSTIISFDNLQKRNILFSSLPTQIKDLSYNTKLFKSILKS